MQGRGEYDELWRSLMTGEAPALRKGRDFWRRMPAHDRCKLCSVPLDGLGAPFARVLARKRRARKSPRLCNMCENLAETHPGGAQVELTMMFADVRGSTALAENVGTAAYADLMHQFYFAANKIIIQEDGLVDKLVGDEVIGLFIPVLTGERHAGHAIEAATRLLLATGHGRPEGPWVPIGIGVHTGIVYAGTVGGEGFTDFSVLGDPVNVAARLSSNAGAGELLVSESAYSAADLRLPDAEQRELSLKGRNEPVRVRVIRASSG